MKRLKGYYQYNQEDCGAACLATILNYYGRKASISILKNKMLYDRNGASVLSIIETAKKYGMESEAYEGTLDELKKEIGEGNFQLPLILHIEKKEIGGHYVVLKKIKNGKIKIFDPKDGHISLSENNFLECWTGILICFQETNKDEYRSETPSFSNNYKYIFLLMENKNILGVAILLSMAMSIISILGAWAYKIIIDDFIIGDLNNNNFVELPVQYGLFFLILLCFYCFQSLISGIRDVVICNLTKKLSNRLAKSFFSHILNISEKDIFYFETGDITARYQSIVQVQRSMLNIIFTVSTELVGIIIGTIVLLKLSSQLFWFVIAMLVIYILIFILGLPFLKRNRKKYYSSYSESMTELNQIISGRSVIVMQNKVSWFFNKALKKVEDSNKSLFNLGCTEALITAGVILIESLGGLAILWKGTSMVIAGELSLGSLIVFQSMLNFFIVPVQKLVLVQDELQNLNILLQRLNDLFVIKLENIEMQPVSNKNINYDIKLIHVDFSYQYSKNIFHNLCLNIPMGSKIGLIGKSGSGKTTLLKIIASLYKPQSGKVCIDDIDYEKILLSTVRSKIAYVPQEPFVFQGSIIDNLLMGEYLTKEKTAIVKEISIIFGLHNFDVGHNNDLDFLVQENGNNLSGGQKQKIGLARALIKKPQIILLDEALSNIDKESREEIFEYLYSNDNLTIVSISHDDSVYKYSDFLWELNDDTINVINNNNKGGK